MNHNSAFTIISETFEDARKSMNTRIDHDDTDSEIENKRKTKIFKGLSRKHPSSNFYNQANDFNEEFNKENDDIDLIIPMMTDPSPTSSQPASKSTHSASQSTSHQVLNSLSSPLSHRSTSQIQQQAPKYLFTPLSASNNVNVLSNQSVRKTLFSFSCTTL